MSDPSPSQSPRRSRHFVWIAAALLFAVGVPVALSSLSPNASAKPEAEAGTGGGGASHGPGMSGGILGTTKLSGGAVSVELTPASFADGRLVVDIRVNTHTVNDLDKYDLKSITTLETAGESVAPVSAPKLAGHHNSGELEFPLRALPDSMTITIQGLDEPATRIFLWSDCDCSTEKSRER